VPWEYFKNPKDAIASVKAQGIKLCVLEHTDSSVPYYSIAPKDFPLCLVVGNEITGIAREIVAEADMAVDIPMYGLKQSLNVAVAYGIALYNFVRILKSS
jgi:tRNA G18 (ribose-2'-O)-methylase SpoU